MGRASKKKQEPKLLKLDFGCGKNTKADFEGVDVKDFGQKYKVDLTQPWPWKDNSVAEAHASHVVEHFTAEQRVHFINELYRVLVPEGKCLIITPHWASCRAYGDLTHQWPPVSEFWFYYLSKAWREVNAPHNDGYTCNFDAAWGYGVKPELMQRNPEYQQYAMINYKEAITDMMATLTKK